MNLMRVNPQYIPVRDQGIRLVTVAVAGPALIYSGIKYPGSTRAKVALAALGGLLIYTNFHLFAEALEDETQEDENEEIKTQSGI